LDVRPLGTQNPAKTHGGQTIEYAAELKSFCGEESLYRLMSRRLDMAGLCGWLVRDQSPSNDDLAADVSLDR
jgi:hypothetical protein